MTETSLHTLDVTWEDILRQMLSCDRLRINCQNYKAFFKKFPKDSGRFCMIILIYLIVIIIIIAIVITIIIIIIVIIVT